MSCFGLFEEVLRGEVVEEDIVWDEVGEDCGVVGDE